MKAPKGYLLVKGDRYDEMFENSKLYRYFQPGRETHDINYRAQVLAVPDAAGDGIAAEVLPGDTVYFHYNTFLNNDHNYSLEDDAWRVPYFDILAAVRGGVIIPVGGWCFVEPGVERREFLAWSEEVRSETWGVLRHLGTPKEGFVMNPQAGVGDVVLFEKADAWVNRIEGVEYYCMQQDRIAAVVVSKRAL